MAEEGRLVSGKGTQVSIIIPTYNESQNILKVLKSIGDILPKNILAEAISLPRKFKIHGTIKWRLCQCGFRKLVFSYEKSHYGLANHVFV